MTIFGAVADALHNLSLDLVKIVCCYLASTCSIATAGATPKLLFRIESPDMGDDSRLSNLCWGVACSPDNKIMVTSGPRIVVFSAEGKYLRWHGTSELGAMDMATRTDRQSLWCLAFGIAFTADGCACIVDHEGHSVIVCNTDSKFSLVRRYGGSAKGVGLLQFRIRATLPSTTKGGCCS